MQHAIVSLTFFFVTDVLLLLFVCAVPSAYECFSIEDLKNQLAREKAGRQHVEKLLMEGERVRTLQSHVTRHASLAYTSHVTRHSLTPCPGDEREGERLDSARCRRASWCVQTVSFQR